MSGKPIDEAALTTVSFLDGGVVQMDRADYDRLTAAQQQGQAKDCHCATCTCRPGMTPAVRFDTSPAAQEGAVRDHLIALGWTPPGAQQQGQAVAEVVQEADGVNLRFVGPILPAGTKLYTAPPSAPVGVKCSRCDPGALQPCGNDCAHVIGAASPFAQQPAAVDEAWLSKARSLYDRCSVYPETNPDGMTALLELRNHVYSILATQHQEPTT